MKKRIHNILVCVLFFSLSALATHNRSGEIFYKRLPPFTNLNYTYSITVIKYFDDGPAIADRCVDTIYFGDGAKGIAPRINGASGSCCAASSSCGVIIVNESGYKVKMSVYSIVHTYPGPGSYLIRSVDYFRNAGIYNIPNSVNEVFYLEAVMNLTSNLGENTSPVLTRPPIDRATTAQCFYHNPCAYDVDGDSLSYELIACKGAGGNAIPGYTWPPSTAGGLFFMSPVTGQLEWCKPQLQGVFQCAFLVKEWRKFGCTGTFQQIGYVERDMEIVVGAGSSTYTLSTSGYRDTCVVAGSVLNFSVSAAINPVTGINSSFWNNLGFLKDNTLSVISSTSVSDPGAGTWSSVAQWTPACSDVLGIPPTFYSVFTVSGTLFQHYDQFAVHVILPAPKIIAIQADTSKVTVIWHAPYTCPSAVTGYNIYRKIGSNNWTHSYCETGVPASSGFVLVGSTDSDANTFVDNDLWSIPNGSQANYLVTAVTKNCKESYADSAKMTTLIVGLKEKHLESSVKVFPNPFSNKIDMQVMDGTFSDIQVSLYSADGKEIWKRNLEQSEKNVQLETGFLNSGIYMLRFKTGEDIYYQKLLKE